MGRALLFAIAAPVLGAVAALIGTVAVAGFTVLLTKMGMAGDHAVYAAWLVVTLTSTAMFVSAMTTRGRGRC